ncbi:integral membrane transporter [Streptomyces azureus]|uniref:Integral membrane transporter n=1 Tax=Streptomyces azureus TaxID=146537 RepID=A0A0K8PFC6_STRAJ|nr:integral membrane transporter [Streptomyces azureus]
MGDLIEWYGFGVYGCFATIIAARFFTAEGGSEAGALVKTSFALAFFFRPIGAALLGRLGDRVGRRPVLVLVITLTTVATTLIGALPTYAQAGGVAPWLLTVLRVLQGLSAGGEFGGAVSVMTAFAPPSSRLRSSREIPPSGQARVVRVVAVVHGGAGAAGRCGSGSAARHAAGDGAVGRVGRTGAVLVVVRAVADAVRPVGAREAVASGGGTRNPVLTRMLAELLPGVGGADLGRTRAAVRREGGLRLRGPGVS